jgi:hypothetical protein
MNTPRDNNMDPRSQMESGELPTDPELDALLNEALSAKHVPIPKGMNDRILAAMAEAHKTGSDSDGNEGHVLASIGIARWVWIGLAAAAVFAVSAFLLLQGTGATTGSSVVVDNGNSSATDGLAAGNILVLQEQLKQFDNLGNSQRDPLDRDLAALDSRIDELNKMWAPVRSIKSGPDKF